MRLEDSVTSISGVGEKLAVLLKRLNIKTVEDVLLYFPRTYNDYSNVVKISNLTPGAITIKATVESITGRYVRRGLHVTEAVLSDDSGKVKAVWFNQPYLANSIPKSIELFFSGNFELGYKTLSIQNPVWEKVSELSHSTARIVPVYRETKGITSRQIRKVVQTSLEVSSELKDLLPYKLHKIDRAKAIMELHFPKSQKNLQQAMDYLGHEELFVLIAASQLARREHSSFEASSINFDEQLVKDFITGLPFSLTDAQRKVSWQIIQDIESKSPSNRLVQGDVGSGKTVVAAIAALLAVKSGLQVGFIAPTEILARQHAVSISKLLKPFGVEVALLVGGINNKFKQTTLQSIKDGRAQVVIGTHALLEPKVEFKQLGLVVIDEQHRFGVKQREKLQQKGSKVPHLLSLSATPIPRSLALTVYGDLDVSAITQMPKGRQPIKTQIVRQSTRNKVYDEINQQISDGRQVYVICPLVEESDKMGLKSVTAEYELLQKTVFKTRRIGLLHGRLKPEEKEAIMSDFNDGNLDILVSTTVVEVGVDVPNATVILIEGAERFGLAQLHQLRGRVGRGEHQSFCYLAPTNDQFIGKRLRALASINDGFKLAELDLELRGPGAIYGLRQHGQLDLRFAELGNTKLIAEVQKNVKEFLDSDDPNLYPELMKRIVAARSITQLN